jgi:hypothetical protein
MSSQFRTFNPHLSKHDQNTSPWTSLAAMFRLRNQWDLSCSLSLNFQQLLLTYINDMFPLSNILIDFSILRNGLSNSMMEHPTAQPCDHWHQAVSLVIASQLNLPETNIPSSRTGPTILQSSPHISTTLYISMSHIWMNSTD